MQDLSSPIVDRTCAPAVDESLLSGKTLQFIPELLPFTFYICYQLHLLESQQQPPHLVEFFTTLIHCEITVYHSLFQGNPALSSCLGSVHLVPLSASSLDTAFTGVSSRSSLSPVLL